MHTKNEMEVTIDSITIENGGDANQKLPKEQKSRMKKKNQGNRTRLLCMLFLTFGYFVVEIIVGYITNSVALVADSFHMLSDVISLVIAYVAVRMSPKKWSQNTFGWARAEVLGALVNAVFLVALCFTIVIESIKRFITIDNIENPKLILIVGTVGLVVNLIGLVLFREHGHSHGGGGSHGHSHGGHGHSHGGHSHKAHHPPAQNVSVSTLEYEDKGKPVDLVNWSVLSTADNNLEDNFEEKSKSPEKSKTSSATQMNMHGVFLHVMADALGSVIVIISALVIWLTEWELKMYVDPCLSLIMVILIMCSVWPLFVESAMVLLQTVPTHIQIDELKQKLLSKVNGAYEVHEFHVWQLSGNKVIASAHILCNSQEDFMRIGEEVKEFFHNEGIHSTTIQLEWENPAQNPLGQPAATSDLDGTDGDSDTRSDCFLTCPFDEEDTECVNNSCCGVQKKKLPVLTGSTLTNTATFPSQETSELPLPSLSRANLGYVDSDEDKVIKGSKSQRS